MRIKEKNGDFVIVDFNELDAYKIACKIEEIVTEAKYIYKSIQNSRDNEEDGKELLFK